MATNPIQKEQEVTRKSEQKSKKTIIPKLKEDDQIKILKRVTKDIEDMKSAKQNGIVYDSRYSDVDLRYKRDDELFLMINEVDDSGWANMKSNALYKTLTSLSASFVSNGIKDTLKGRTIRDINIPAKIHTEIINNFNELRETENIDSRSYDEMVMHGVAIEYIPWKKLPTKIKVEDTKFSKENKQFVDKGIIPYIWEERIEYDDIDIENVLPHEFLIERGTYRLHGTKKAANKCALVQWISYDDFKKWADNDKAVIKENIEKVQDSGAQASNDFWQRPKTSGLENQVEKWTFFDKIECEIVTVVNGNLMKVQPLPFGVLPFADYHFMELKDEFWTPGLAAFLDPTIREQERVFNNLVNGIILDTNPVKMIDSQFTEEFMAGGERFEVGQMVSITGLAQNPNIIKEMPTGSGRSVEAFRVLDTFEQNFIEISGINARRFGSLQRSYNASEVQLVDAATDNIINRTVRRYFQGRVNRIKMMVRWITQEYPKARAMDMFGHKFDKPQKRKILLDSKEFTYEATDLEKLDEKMYNGFAEFEISNDKMLKFEGEFTLPIDSEFIKRMNRERETQKWATLFPQTAQLAGDPRYTPDGQPIAPFNIYKLAEGYSKAFDIEDTLNIINIDPKEDRLEAEKENQRIMNGEIVIGRPGRTRDHLDAHDEAIYITEMYIKEKEEEVNKIKDELMQNQQMAMVEQAQMMGIPPEAIQMQPEMIEPPKEEMALNKLKKNYEYLLKHRDLDGKPVGDNAIQALPQEQMMQGQTMASNPMMDQMAAMGMGGIPAVTGGTPPGMPGSPVPQAPQSGMVM